jgi:hypothetical protein
MASAVQVLVLEVIVCLVVIETPPHVFLVSFDFLPSIARREIDQPLYKPVDRTVPKFLWRGSKEVGYLLIARKYFLEVVRRIEHRDLGLGDDEFHDADDPFRGVHELGI